MEVFWLEQNDSEVPLSDAWLGAGEIPLLARLRFQKRRGEWRLGRWTAKRAVAAYLGLPRDPPLFARIEILPAPSGAPEAFLAGQPAPVAISLSHSSGAAVCAVARTGASLGCDIESIAPRGDAFARDYFTAAEQAQVSRLPAADRPAVLALLWSAKESLLKALRYGLRADPLDVNVDVRFDAGESATWRPLLADYKGDWFTGRWQHRAGFVRTLICRPDAAAIHSLG